MQPILANKVIKNKKLKINYNFDIGRVLHLTYSLVSLGVDRITIGTNSQVVVSTNPNNIFGLIVTLVKLSSLNYKILLDLTVTDKPQNLNRFSINYNLRN